MASRRSTVWTGALVVAAIAASGCGKDSKTGGEATGGASTSTGGAVGDTGGSTGGTGDTGGGIDGGADPGEGGAATATGGTGGTGGGTGGTVVAGGEGGVTTAAGGEGGSAGAGASHPAAGAGGVAVEPGGGAGEGGTPAASTCGDDTCDASESCASCAADCGECPSATALCEGLVTDTAPHPMPTLAQPAVGERVVDPAFGTTVVRVSDAGAGGVIKPMYSTIQAWNADESLMVLYHVDGGHHLYDGRTYEHLRALDIDPSDLEHVFWDTTDPDLLYYVDAGTNTLVRYHARSGQQDAVHEFTSCDGSVSAGADPMFTSWDSNVFGLRCSDGNVFGYWLDTDQTSPPLPSDSDTAPQPAPSGELFYFDGEVLDRDLRPLRTLDLADPWSHASLGRLAGGHDTYNGVQWDPGERCDYGTLVVYDLTDGGCRVVIGETNGYPYPTTDIHVSAVAHRNPGWVGVSIVGDPSGQEPLDQEIVLADTNPGGAVCRVAHHHSHGREGPQGYWAEPHVVISPTATRLLFGSDWGGQDSVDAYVVELPSYAAP